MAISDKILYLNDTKKLLKQEINKSTEITDEDTFRSYAPKIYDGYLDLLNNGTETLWNNLEKVSTSEETPVLENVETAPIKMVLNGNTSQKIIPKDAGKEVIDTNIAITDVDIEKESYIELNGNTSQEIIPKDVGKEVIDTNIAITDVDIEKESYIELNGNSSQETTTGKNLLDTNNISYSSTSTSLTINSNANGEITINGESYDGNVTIKSSLSTPLSGTYTLIFKKISGNISNNNINFRYAIGNAGNGSAASTTGRLLTNIFNGDSNIVVSTGNINDTMEKFHIYFNAGATFNNYKFVIYLVQGTYTSENIPDYEPYTGGQPSPSPDYPQEVKVVTGENVVSVSGKNLFDVPEEYKVVSNISSIPISIEAGRYIISVDSIITDGSADTSSIIFYYEDGTTYATIYLSNTSKSKTLNFTKKVTKYNIYSQNTWTTSQGVTATFNKLMIRSQSIADDTYVPYSKTDYPINLGTLELCKIGNYQDYLYKNNGKWYVHKEIEKILLDGTQTINGFSTHNGTTYITANFNNSSVKKVPNANMISNFSNKLVGATGTQTWQGGKLYSVSQQPNGYYLQICLPYSVATTSAELSTWLASNNILVYYLLETPTEEEITDTSLIAQLDNLHTAELQETSYINSTPTKEYPYINLKYNVVTPAPSPDRASEINKVTGNNVVSVSGKNLYNENKETDNYYYDGNGEKAIGTRYINIDYIPATEQITISFSARIGSSTYVRVCEYTASGTFIKRTLVSSNQTITFDTNTAKVIFSIDKGISAYFTDLMIEVGSTATPYVPYSKTDYPLSLGTLELCKIGNYQDYLYKNNGKWYVHKEIGKKIFNGTENWSFITPAYATTKSLIPNINAPFNATTLKCSHFIIKQNATANIGEFRVGNQNLNFNFDNGEGGVDNFKTWLSNNNVTLYYVLATPTEEEITNTTLIEQLETLYTAKLVNSTTYISTIANNLKPFIDLNYNVVIPSPSPEKPSEVKVVKGENIVSVSGKNLFDKDNATIIQGYFDYSHTSIISTSSNRTTYLKVKPNTTYSISKLVSTRSWLGTTQEIPTINTQVSNISNFSGGNYTYDGITRVNATITTGANDSYIVLNYTNTNSETGEIPTTILNSIQIEENSQATPYVPYSKTDYPINLGTLELCKIGDYKDYFYKDSGKWYVHKEIGKKIFDGTEYWRTVATDTTDVYRMLTTSLKGSILAPATSSTQFLAFCSRFKPIVADNTYKKNEGISCARDGNVHIYMEIYNTSTSATDFKTWLSTHNVTLYYVLATPTETEITNTTLIEQLEAIANAKSVKDKTYITQTNDELPFILDVEAIKEYEENLDNN